MFETLEAVRREPRSTTCTQKCYEESWWSRELTKLSFQPKPSQEEAATSELCGLLKVHQVYTGEESQGWKSVAAFPRIY